MTTWGESMGGGGRPSIGIGYSMPPQPTAKILKLPFSSFKRGLILSDLPEDITLEASPSALDMEVTNNDRLIPAPGVALVEDAGHSLKYIFLQASVDFATELVAIDPPWMLHKAGGAFVANNVGIVATGAHGWNAVNVGGVLLFSNGEGATYSRAANAIVVVDQSAQVVARTFAVQFGRVFAGSVVIGGNYQALAISWNAASGAFNDWVGIGANTEFLLTDLNAADKIVALRPLGFDLLAILCRNSLWAGYPTGDTSRPADFRTRFPGTGCVGEATAKLTPQGVTFLSDAGVASYNVSQVNIISAEINAELLPLDYLQLDKYTATYIPSSQRYILTTPSCTWVYEFPTEERPGRWFKRSLIADNVIAFPNQSGNYQWDLAAGTWDSQTTTWNNSILQQGNEPATLYYVKGQKLYQESSGYMTNDILAALQSPCWRLPPLPGEDISDQWQYLRGEITYSATTDVNLTVRIPDYNGVYNQTRVVLLPSTGGVTRRRPLDLEQLSGMGTNIEVQPDKACYISRIQLKVKRIGPYQVPVG